MGLSQIARQIISTLTRNRFRATCPCCQESISLSKAGLFYADEFTPDTAEWLLEQQRLIAEQKAELRERKRKLASVSELGAQSVNQGRVLEKLAPSMKSFPFHMNDCRRLSEPLDYVIFHGLTERKIVDRIIFTDIKTGGARLTSKQKTIRSLVLRGKIRWETYSRGTGL